jgi:hypothetical protein
VGQHGSASGSLLLDLDGLEVVSAELAAGEWQLVLQTTARMAGSVGCGCELTSDSRTPNSRPMSSRIIAGPQRKGELQLPWVIAHHQGVDPLELWAGQL